MTHQQKEPNLHSLYNDLGKACRSQSFSKILTLADKILASFHVDDYAIKCRVVALVHMERYEDCLEFIRKRKLSNCAIEKAYCEYRLNKLNDSLNTINNSGLNNVAAFELKAQILYRMEKFDQSLNCYDEFLNGYEDDYTDERLTNILANKVGMCDFRKGVETPLFTLYEVEFNRTCGYISNNDYENALKHITTTEQMCLKSFEVDSNHSNEELNDELAPIRIQKAYILQQQQKEKEASDIYHDVLRQRSGDPSLLAVTANNLLCINREQNIFDTRKRMKSITMDNLKHKLLRSQRFAMLVNQGLFFLHTGQLDGCRAKVGTVLDEEPNYVRGLLLSATLNVKKKQLSSAINLIKNFIGTEYYKNFISHDNKSNLLVTLFLVHLHLLQFTSKTASNDIGVHLGGEITLNDSIIIFQLMEQILSKEQLNLPAIVAFRVALCLKCLGKSDVIGDDANEAILKAKSFVLDCLNWWTKNVKKETQAIYEHLLEQCSDFLIQHGFWQESADLLELRINQLKHDSNETLREASALKQQSLLAMLIKSFSKFDQVKAENASRELKFKDPLNEKDIDALEASFLFGVKNVKRSSRATTQPTPKSLPNSTQSVSEVENKIKCKHMQQKKKRKIRLPKNYEPGIPQDPERWLPRRERTGYRGKRRDKRGANLLRGPQGQTTAAPELDIGKRSPKVAPVTTSTISGDSNEHPTPTRKPIQSSRPHNKRKNKRNR